MNETACQGFEIAIEMRRHGAAEPEASRRLDEHLRGCAGCRSYANLGAETEVRLRAEAEDARHKTDLERLRARGRRILGGIWSDLGAFSVLISLALVARVVLGIDRINTDMSALAAILSLAWPFVVARRSRRELEEAWSSDVLFYALRTDVSFRLKGSVFLGVVCIGVAVFSVFVHMPDHGPVYGIARSLFLACFGALGVFVLAVRVPRLLRELREIPSVPDPFQHSSDWFFGLL